MEGQSICVGFCCRPLTTEVKAGTPRRIIGEQKAVAFRQKRQYVYDRDGNQCLACETEEWLTLDHIIPRSKGGNNCTDNLQTLCRGCNQEKGSQTIDYRKT